MLALKEWVLFSFSSSFLCVCSDILLSEVKLMGGGRLVGVHYTIKPSYNS